MTDTTASNHPFASQQLASFAAALNFDAIPEPVIRKTEDLLVDWFGSCVAGKGARAVETIAAFAASAGPASGSAEVLINRSRTSAYFAAMVNAGVSLSRGLAAASCALNP